MKAKTGFNRFVSIFLSVAIAISALAGLSLGGLVSAAGEEIGTMKFFVNHWHTVDESGNPISETETHEDSNYHEEFSGTIVALDGGTYKLNPEDLTDNKKFVFNQNTGELTVKVSPRGTESDTWESLAGLSVSAGHNAVDTQADEIVITYKNNVSVVKCDIFYKNDSKYVSGGYDNKVEGTKNLENDTGYVYVDDATGEPVRDGADNLITETNESKTDHLVEAQTQNSGSPVRLVKMYSTLEGLHTDKTAYAVEDDGRTFNLELESWYVGAKAADVGMILDASGSMASPTNTLKPISDAIKRLDDLSDPIDSNGFLTDEAVKRILKQTETDNSPLGVSGYGYYIFDGRSSTNDYFPIGYWDGTTNTKPVYKYDIPERDSLIGYYPFFNTGGAYGLNRATNKEATKVEQQDISSDLNFDTNGGSTSYSNSDGFRLFRNSTNYGGLKLSLGKDGTTTVGDTFTISFRIKGGGDNPNYIKEILYIGPNKNPDGNYFSVYRNGHGSEARLVARNGGTNGGKKDEQHGTVFSNVNTIFNKSDHYITYVFEKGALKVYVDGTENTDGSKTTEVNLSGENVIVIGGLKDQYDGSNDLTIDEIYVYNTALGKDDVSKIYDLQKNNKNIEDINATTTEVGTYYVATDSSGNTIGTVKSSEMDKPAEGWYYVSFNSEYGDMYNDANVGTGKDFRHLHGGASYQSGDDYYDLVYYYDYDEVKAKAGEIDSDTSLPQVIPGMVSSSENFKKIPLEGFAYDDTDPDNFADLKLDGKNGENKIKSYYTLSESSEKKAQVSRIVYNPADKSDSNCTPLKFFIDPEGYLCCFFSNNHNDKDMDNERYGWSYVFSNEGHTERTKVESLQYALGTFATGLLEASSSSRVSATRFSTDDITDADYGNFVLLDWTNDPQEANSILSLERGTDVKSKGSSTGYDKDTDESGKPELHEYNYGLTGGTTTEVGLKAYSENLDKKLGSDDNREKYLIIFTDGKDTSDAIKNYTGDVGEDFAKCIQGLSGADAAPAYTAAKQLKDKGYTIYCVMLAGGAMGTESKDYGLAKQFLTYLSSGCPADGESYNASAKSKYVLSGTNTAELEQAFKNILDDIASDLEDYTVQDYIDPRFDLVDADGNTWNLKAKGEVEITLKDAAKPTTITKVEYDESDGTVTESGDTMPANLSKTVGLEINLSNDGAYKDEGNIAYLFYDETANMYFLRWLDQSIPSCTPGSSRLPVWNARVTVRAKDDFIGGNAVTTNGNSADQNYVYMNDDTAPSSGTTNAGKNYDPAAASYPSKGFPRTTVNVAVPSLVLTGGEQVIYMGEELTPDGVAEKLGETILDKWEDTKDDRTQWYWEYLDRYANYATDEDGNKLFANGLEDIIQQIVDEESIEYPYFYIPRYDGDNKLLNQTGSSDHHEKDRLGTLKFTWTTVDEEKEGKEYPESNKGGTTVDTLQRVSTLEVQYTPLQADDGTKGDDTKDREDYIKDIVQTEEDSGEDVYPWDSDYKPAPGQNTYEEDEIGTGDNEDDHIPMDSDSGKYNRLASEGSYTTNIVKGEIWLQVELKEEDIKYLQAHYPGNKKISYTIPLKRTYEGGITDVTVGNFKFTKQISELQTLETAKFTPDPKYTEMLEKYGLPIGSYTLGTPEPTEPYGFLQFGNPEVHVITSDDLILFTGYSTATGISLTEEEKVLNKAAPYEDGTIYLGYGSDKYYPDDDEGHKKGDAKDGSGRRYTDDLLGMYIASPTLLKGNLSITKTVEDTATFTAQHEAYGNQTFTFEVTLEGVSGQFTLKHEDGTTETVGTEGEAFTKVQIKVQTDETVTIEGIPAGTSYTVTEVTPPVGYTIDDDDKLTVTGEIKATGEGTAEANFKNIYRADGTSVFEITKTLIGRKWADDETFTFVVKPYEDDDIDGTTDGETISTKDAIEKGYVTMPEGSDLGDGTYKIAVAKNETDDSSFTVETDPISFTKEGTYKFTVSEIREEDQLDDVIIDDNKYLLTVEVFDDGESNLTASNYAYETCDEMEDGGFPFKNTVSTQIDFDITKVLKGREWDGDRFDVDIEYVPEESTKSYSGAEAPFIDASPVTISDEDPVKTTVTFYSVGTYTFTVKEANGTDSNMLYDEEYKDGHTVIVVVGQNDDVGLTITSITVDGKKIDSTSAADITITNEYTVTKDVSIDIPVTKTFADGKWIDGTYSFDIDFDDSVSKEDRDKITFSNKTITIEKEGESPNFGTISFNGIVLEEDPINGYSKTFKFVVKEQNGGKKIDGITYDKTVYNVEVTITDQPEPDDVIVKVGTGDVTVMSFENVYSADPAEWTPKVQKTFTGRAWLNTDEFTFTITQDEGDDVKVTLPPQIKIGANTDDHTASFDAITFDKAGTYNFTISEAEPTANGITKETSDYKVKVVVTDNLKGQLEYTVTYTDSESKEVEVTDNTVKFTNTYTPDPVTWTPSIDKQIEDPEGTGRDTDWQDSDSFTFEITLDSPKGDTSVTMPVPNTVTISNKNSAGSDGITRTGSFGEITFNEAGDYTFTIKENGQSSGGIIHDTHGSYTVKVTVEDDANGKLIITLIAYKDRKGTDVDQTTNTESTSFLFINTHKHKAVHWYPTVSKDIDGRDWISGDEFGFTIKLADGQEESIVNNVNMPSTNVATVTKENTPTDFKDITFTEIGVYKFIVKENDLTESNGLAKDETKYTVTVTVANKPGTENELIITEVEVYNSKTEKTETYTAPEDVNVNFKFTNIYSASGTIDIPVSKNLEGRAWKSTDSFKFEISTTDKNVTIPADSKTVTINGTDGTEGTLEGKFADIKFTKVGTYTFTIEESQESKIDHITYSKEEYTVEVTVKDQGDGTLDAEITKVTDKAGNNVAKLGGGIIFTNTYTPDSVEWTPSIDKQINDPEGTGRDETWQDSDSFTFEITLDSPKGDTSVTMPVPNTVTISNKNSAGSDGITRTGSFGEITFNEAGDYTFTIKENGQSSGGIIHDTHGSYTVKVTVEDDTNGKLSITHIAYEDRKGTDVDQTTNTASTSFLFINTHKHKAVHWYPTVSKDIDGRNWISGDEFKFTIELAKDQAHGTVVSTVQMENPNVATVTKEKTPTAFEDITFTEIGVYKFIVTENDLTESNGLTKDKTEYTVTVTVENKPGTENELIIAKVEVNDGKTTKTYTASEGVSVNFEFTNTYSASGTIDIPVSKNLEGRAWKSTDSFTFEISTKDENVTIPATSKTVTINGIDGTEGTLEGKFEGIEFTKVGTYTFTIEESQESKIDHITYSTEKYTVEVTVKDNGNGTLNATITKVTEAKDPTKNLVKDGVVFTNTYTPDSVEWTPYVSKTIVDEGDPTRGEKWLEEVGKDTFTFTVSIAGGKNYGDNVVMPKNAKVTVDHTNHTSSVPFDAIKFTKGGIYEFVIEETEGKQDGIIYDHTKYNVTVEVSDDTTNGTLSIASVEYTYKDSTGKTVTEKATDVENVTFPFVNKHHHDAVKLDLSAQKELTGREWHGDEFTFTVTQDSSDTFTAQMSTTNTATVSGPNAVEFSSDITFTEVGEYHFTVKENELSDDVKKYITPVVSEHKVYVKIDDHDGKLYISEMKIDGKEVTDLPEPSDPDFEAKRPTISHVLEFENKYSAKSAQIQIPVSKVLDGRKWTADDSFTFTISPDTYSSTNKITITNKSEEYSEGDIEGYQGFFDLTFELDDIDTSKEVNEFTFTIKESQESKIDHIDYSDEEYTVTVKVTDDYKGKLTAEITEVTKAGEDVTALGEGIIFTNTYTPAPVEWTPSVTKEINGRSEWNPNYSFDFTITPESTDGIYYKDSDGNEQPYTAQDIFINSETPDHTESFKTVIFRQEGTYTFKVKETVPDGADENNQLNGITYDGNDHKIVVTVIDNEGQLEISTITVDETDVTTKGKVTTNVTIINTYSANGSWPPIVEKSFDTRKWDDSDNGKYTFVLSLEKTPSGVDKSTVTIPNGGTITISGGKKDAESVTGTFGDVGFTKPGTYEFKLTEKTYTGGRGVTSAETVYNITVEVTDNGNGKLTTVSAVTKDGEEYNGTNYAFVNTYTPSPATWTPSVQKTLEGAGWNGYTFIFSITLLSKDDISYDDATTPYEYHEVEISSAADNTADFKTVTFTKAGTYVFTIAEVDTGIDNIVYDKTGRIVTVEVVDDPVEGKLKIDLDSITVNANAGTNSYTLNGSDNISFTNYYTKNAIVKNAIKVEKELDIVNGRDWLSSDTFSFRLTLTQGDASNVVMKVGGETVDELTAVISGSDPTKSAVFSDIEFTAEGTYVFTVSEIIPNGATGNVYQGVTYDENPYEVTVEVTLEEEIIDDTDPDNIIKEYYLVAEVQDNDDGVNDGIVTFSFTNTAVPATLAEAINVKKTLDGKDDDWGSDSFSFKIEPDVDYGEDVVMPTETEISISADTPAHTAYFDKIIFNTIGEYHFTVSEVIPAGVDSDNTLDDITYDVNTHEVVVKVDVDANNNLVATIQGSDTVTVENNTVTVEFTNKYTSPSTPTSPSTDPTPPTDPTPSTPTQPSENTTSEDTSVSEQTTGPEETTPEETTSEETTASSEESTVLSEETTPDTTDDEEVSENDGYNTNVDGDGDKNMNTGVPFGSAIMMCALSSLAVAVAVRKKKNGRNDK